MRRTILLVLLSIFVLTSCRRLRIENFPVEMIPASAPFLTAQINYQRNAFNLEELNPPLKEDWVLEYKFLPVNGFTISDHWLFFGAANGDLVIVDADTGLVIGKKRFSGYSAGPPTLYKNILYQTYESGSYGLIAYDILNGELLWSLEGNHSLSSPVIDDNKLFLQTKQGLISCYNYLTGDRIWSAAVKSEMRNSPTLYGNLLVSAGLNGTITVLEYTSGVIVWQKSVSVPLIADPVIEGDNLYIAGMNGAMFIYDIHSGNLIKQFKFDVPIYYSPTIDNIHIYIPLSSGEMIALDKNNFKMKWSYKSQGPVSNSPLVTKSYIYFADLVKWFYILDKITGTLIQEIELEGRVRSTPIIKNNRLIISCEDDKVLSYVEEN